MSCVDVNQGSVTSSQEVVNVTLSISHAGVKFRHSASNVSKLYLYVFLWIAVWLDGKGKDNGIAVHGTPSHSYGVSLAIWDHTVLPSTQPVNLPTPEG